MVIHPRFTRASFSRHEKEGVDEKSVDRATLKPVRGFLVASAYCPEFRDEGRIDPHSRGARTRTLSRIILATRGKISIPRVDADDEQTKGQNPREKL